MITEGYKGVWRHLLSARDEYKETVKTFYFRVSCAPALYVLTPVGSLLVSVCFCAV